MSQTPITTERVELDDVGLQVTVAGEGPLVVLLHGFPELAFSWRHQIRGLADAGYRVVAPDLRGYGASDRPDSVEAYDITRLVSDIVGLVRHEGGGPVVVVGHDWGALIAWATANFRPDLLSGVGAISVPYLPRMGASLLDLIRDRVGPDGFHYMLYFQDEGAAEAELDPDPIGVMRRLFWTVSADMPTFTPSDRAGRRTFLDDQPIPDGLPPWLTDGDLEAYGRAFARTGFRGGLNYYRNLERNWELMAPWHHAPITVPALYVGGRVDPVMTSMAPADDDHPSIQIQSEYCPDLRVRWIEDAGHWAQQEQPEAVTEALLEFLAEVAPITT